MSETIKIIVFISIVLFFQIGIFSHLAVLETYPNIILGCLISFSILRGFKKSLVWAVVAGLFLDFYSLNSVFGTFIVCLLLCSYFSFFLSQNVFKKSSFLSVVSVFALTVVFYNLLVFALRGFFGPGFQFGILTFLINVAYNTIFAIPVFYLMKKNYAGKPNKI
jgi:rod shape-determining protein MreD